MTPSGLGPRGPEETRRRTAELFARLGDTRADGEVGDPGARDELVTLHLPLVEHAARRFRDRGEPHDDLVQVGTIGLINAIDRFDPERGVEFSTFATPTIVGEIQRHFRDRSRAIRLPRRVHELQTAIAAATGDLTQSLGRSPTPRELAEVVGCSVEEIVEGLESRLRSTTFPLHTPTDEAALARSDGSLEHVEIRESVRPLLESLDPRDRRIVVMRFFKNMTQSQIAAELGVSQMQVSRLLTRTLDRLRSSWQEPG
ncbi:MAG: SigB/SigF/SigG family RNA polymerase sigma factor [Nocardioides sp.]|uniref:SigB/SigF/SigG family RNA polymerase sigma factor n=1 Tax=Nocardioides sp. TaxID=35761 RepID=UPI0039E6AD58